MGIEAALTITCDESRNMSTTSGLLAGGAADGQCLVKATETGTGFDFIDCVGHFGDRPSEGWDACGVTAATKDHTLIRKPRMNQGPKLEANQNSIQRKRSGIQLPTHETSGVTIQNQTSKNM